jgi:hypothetical protein
MPAALIQDAASGLALGAMAFLGMLIVLTVLQTIGLLLQGESFPRSIGRSAGTTVGGVVALAGGIMFVFTQGIGVLDVLTNTVATAPLAAAQLVTMVLGVLGMQGHLSDMMFLVGAGSFAVFTVVMREVRG